MISYEIKYIKDTTVIMTSVSTDERSGENGAEENICTRVGGVKGGRRNLNNEELHNLNSSLHIIITIKSIEIMWAGHVVHVGDTRNMSKILIKKLEGKRLFEGHRHNWEKYIQTDIRKLFVAF
jgi:hypothetical protein